MLKCRFLLYGFVFTVIAACDSGDRQERAYRPEPWIADFQRMKTAIAERSPNLDWQIERGLKLEALASEIERELRAAPDDGAARDTLEYAMRRFADGHMRLSWSGPEMHQAASPSAEPVRICEASGYWRDADRSALLARLDGYERLSQDGSWNVAGVIQSESGPIGVLRIPLFAPNATLCERALAELSIDAYAPCDDACKDRVRRRADVLYLREIADGIGLIQERGAGSIIVDLAGNGGGSDLSLAVARMLAPKHIPTPALGVDRTPERMEDLREKIAFLENALADATQDEGTLLNRLIVSLQDALADIQKDCDRMRVWSGELPQCASTITGPFFAGGLVAVDLPKSMAVKDWAVGVSSLAGFEYEAELWRGGLAILVDQGTGSSSELFTAMLQDGDAALVIGSPTAGASCGWSMPRKDILLEHSGGILSLPNCARFRANGDNELDGIQPDIYIGFRRYDTPLQRARRMQGNWRHISSVLKSAQEKHPQSLP